MPEDWYPKVLAQLIVWHSNFASQLATHAVTLGIPAGTLTQVNTNRDNVASFVNGANTALNYGSEVVAFRDIVLSAPLNTPLPAVPTLPPAISFPPLVTSIAGIEAYTRQLVGQIKANANYTEAIGQDLGIIRAAPAPPGVPVLTATALTQSQVQIDFDKAGHPLIAIDRQRGAETGWTQIAIATNSPFVDADPPLVAGQPEVRKYRGQGYANNQRQGATSAVVTVSTNP